MSGISGSGAYQAILSRLSTAVAGTGAWIVGFIQAGAGAVLRTLMDKLRENLTVEDFGADPTGVADSAAAIMAAIAAAGNWGGVRFKPGGIYKCNSSIVMNPISIGIRLFCDGKATLLANHNGDCLVMTAMNEAYGWHTLEGLILQGPNTAYPAGGYAPPSTGAGIKFGGDNSNAASGYNVEIRNCDIKQFKYGMYMQACIGVKVCGATAIRFNQYGVYVDGGQANSNVFDGTLIRENRVAGIYSSGSTAGSLTNSTANHFIGCLIETNIPYPYPTVFDGTGVGVGAMILNSYDWTFESCYFENQNYSVWIGQSSDNHSFEKCRFAPGGAANVRVGGVNIADASTNNNTFDQCTMIGTSTTIANVTTAASQLNNQFLDCNGFVFVPASLASVPFIRNNRLNQGNGGTRVGCLSIPDHGVLRNAQEGSTIGTITGIGTTTATLNANGLGEITFESLITANTTITTIAGAQKHSILVLWNYQIAHPVTLKTGTGTGDIFLKGGDVIFNGYGQMLVLYITDLGRAYEIGRNF